MRESFHGFIEELNIKNKYPGIISVAFIPLVSREDLPHHIQNMKKEGLLDYTIFPSGEMQEYALTSYIEPFDNSQNKKVLGFNSFSD